VAGSTPIVGVLALQGAVREHVAVLEGLGARPRLVKRAEDLAGLWGIVLPGGESTTIGMLMGEYGLRAPLSTGRLPMFGTCAGMILMAREITGEAAWLGVLDVTVVRNAYGRQGESFEADLPVAGIGGVRGVFIRAPYVTRVGPDVEVLAVDGDQHPVVVRQSMHMAAAFHPELAGERRLHAAFVARLTGPVALEAPADRMT